MPKRRTVDVIGGGLAGSEAAYLLLKLGYHVRLFERRPEVNDGAHETGLYGELVCSNSLKSKKIDNAAGLLKAEMKELGSLMVEAAEATEVPSGNALSVDRTLFADYITKKLRSFSEFEEIPADVASFSENPTILATGPLTSGPLLSYLEKELGRGGFSFFDASAPIVKKSSINFDVAYFKSRYSQGDDSYINCPFDLKSDYIDFVNELTKAELAMTHSFDTEYFEGCLPIEVLAGRGIETLRHGPMKPFGLEQEGKRMPYAVVQLRQDDKLGDLYNLVGFQTNLTFPEQKRVFRMIPGLENAEFVRYGLMHRNFYLDAPNVLNKDFSLIGHPNVLAAGQITGVEGYVESAASGIVSALYLDRILRGLPVIPVPETTILGALLGYVTATRKGRLEPMNATWALIPGIVKEERGNYALKSLEVIKSWHGELSGPES